MTDLDSSLGFSTDLLLDSEQNALPGCLTSGEASAFLTGKGVGGGTRKKRKRSIIYYFKSNSESVYVCREGHIDGIFIVFLPVLLCRLNTRKDM